MVQYSGAEILCVGGFGEIWCRKSVALNMIILSAGVLRQCEYFDILTLQLDFPLSLCTFALLRTHFCVCECQWISLSRITDFIEKIIK